jgi:hypothetical protein
VTGESLALVDVDACFAVVGQPVADLARAHVTTDGVGTFVALAAWRPNRTFVDVFASSLVSPEFESRSAYTSVTTVCVCAVVFTATIVQVALVNVVTFLHGGTRSVSDVAGTMISSQEVLAHSVRTDVRVFALVHVFTSNGSSHGLESFGAFALEGTRGVDTRSTLAR